MNGIPNGICWDTLRGKIVEQVSIGQYQVSIAFNDVYLSIEGEYEVVTGDSSYQGSADDPQSSAPLLGLVGLTLQSVSAINQSTIELCFDGIRLRLHDSNDDYESFRITGSNMDVIV